MSIHGDNRMKEFQKLLESELLSSDAKTAIKEAIEGLKQNIREELEVSYAKKLVADKQNMNIKLVALIDESVKNELSELKEDIATARTLEVRYAKKLAEFKEEYKTKLNAALNETINTLVTKEFKELRADLLEAKKNHVFGKLIESFSAEFKSLGLTETESELKSKLDDATAKLAEANKNLKGLTREKKLESVLSNLTGQKREIMSTILENVAEDKIETRYNEALKAVLTEEVAPGGNNGSVPPDGDAEVKKKDADDKKPADMEEAAEYRRFVKTIIG